MKISTKGRYALRIMIDLAQNGNGKPIPLKEISGRQNITLKYMEQIMTMLMRAGYVRSFRGNNGGYTLAKSAGEYTIGDILRMTEGSMVPIACLDENQNGCMRKDACETFAFWEGLGKVINEYLDSATLEDLVSGKYKSIS
ncbi:MAG: Rrf2 family transcriptional regulator [bacterium]|nr:Rrf2 family transcriptional regulator [bacterium]